MAVYKIANGVQVKVSPSEMKKTIMKANEWTETEYKKQYDLFKNKLRAYEGFMAKTSGKASKQSPAEVLYKQAKSKERAKKKGETYRPSAKMKQILKTPALSTNASKKAVERQSYIDRRKEEFGKVSGAAFKNFIEKNETAKKIADSIDDPVKRDQALRDYADFVREKIKEGEENEKNEAIPTGESYGSDIAYDFDYSAYLH